MALTNGKFTNGPLIFLSPRSSKMVNNEEVEVDPHFEVSKVGEDEKIAKTSETADTVSGDLTKIDFKEREHKGKKNKHVVLFVKDGGDTYHLDLTYRISTRSLYNSMLSLSSPKGISIGIYRNKKGFETFSLRQNNDTVKWKYELAELPKAEAIHDKKNVLIKTDYSDVDQFFEDGLRELSVKLFGSARTETAAPAAAAPATTKTEKAAATVAPAPVEDTSVPF